MKLGSSSLIVAGLLAATALFATRAYTASHQWRFHEAFSNADGTVQFIEMQECCGFDAENGLQGKWILAVHANHKYTFRSNLTGNTANKYLLLATQGFADIPGAPAPDFIIPDGFLPVAGDTLEYWTYANATWICPPLPQDGISSVGADGAVSVNSPTNYAGESGSIDLSTPVKPTTWGSLKSGRP